MFSHTLKSQKITPLTKITKHVFFNVLGMSLFCKQHQCHGLEDTKSFPLFQDHHLSDFLWRYQFTKTNWWS